MVNGYKVFSLLSHKELLDLNLGWIRHIEFNFMDLSRGGGGHCYYYNVGDCGSGGHYQESLVSWLCEGTFRIPQLCELFPCITNQNSNSCVSPSLESLFVDKRKKN